MDRCNLVGTARTMRRLSVSILRADKQETLQALASAGIELSHGQYLVLRYLSEKPQTLTKLSHGLNLDPSTLVPIVDSMVQRSLVQRSRNPEDRRCTHLELTAEGARLIELAGHLDENSALVTGMCLLGEEKSRQLVRLLTDYVGFLSVNVNNEDLSSLQTLPIQE